MNKRTLTIMALAISLSIGVANAQDSDVSGMSGGEMLRDANTRLEQMEDDLVEVVAIRDRTENEEDDLAKLRCVNDKIAAIQGYLRLSSDAVDALGAADRGNDREGLEHQYSLVVIASQRVINLQQEANQCAGEILTFAGDTGSDVTVDPSIPSQQDQTASNLGEGTLERLPLDGEPPPEATPYQ